MPLFYLTQPLNKGPPTDECVDAVIKSFDDNFLVAAFACVGCFSFWAAAIAAMPNCCGGRTEEKKDKKKNGHYELSEDVSGMNTTR